MGARYQDYYQRQSRDWKMSAVLEAMRPQSMQVYDRLCGWTLARTHARSGDRIAISEYLGNSNTFDIAVTDFAQTYADQNERDHAALAAAVADGRVEAHPAFDPTWAKLVRTAGGDRGEGLADVVG